MEHTAVSMLFSFETDLNYAYLIFVLSADVSIYVPLHCIDHMRYKQLFDMHRRILPMSAWLLYSQQFTLW
jgi:hypothetical protein